MIEQGVDVNARDIAGYTAAMRAANAGRVDDLQMLIDNGAKMDARVLFMAIHSGNPKLVKMILEDDVVNVDNADLETLMFELKYDPTETVELLLKYDADPNAIDKNGS